jgi:DNA-binding transcriptional MerR regulator
MRTCGVQAHVLRYWESEFPMLAPQKNRAGQRVYRSATSRWRCELRNYFTKINTRSPAPRKRLANDLRGGGKVKVVGSEEEANGASSRSVSLSKVRASLRRGFTRSAVVQRTAEERQGLKQLAAELRELLSLLEQENQNKAK